VAIKQQQIEKKSLEAHVDLCTERYNELNKNVKTMEARIDSLSSHVLGMKEDMNKITGSINNRLITIAGGIIGVLSTALLALIIKVLT
jgi:tetrahydromethanopterin S-methyltransferase subunit B